MDEGGIHGRTDDDNVPSLPFDVGHNRIDPVGGIGHDDTFVCLGADQGGDFSPNIVEQGKPRPPHEQVGEGLDLVRQGVHVFYDWTRWRAVAS